MSKRVMLTDAKVNAIRPRKSEFTIWDKAIAGFGLRIRPSGFKRFVYLRDGKRINLVATSAREARDECLKSRLEYSANNNRDASAPKMTLRRYVEDEWKKRNFDSYVPATQRSMDRTLRHHVLPHFGDRYLHEISRQQVLKWFEKGSRRVPGAMNKALEYLGQILKAAQRDGLIESHPTRSIKLNRMPPKMRFLSAEERARLFAVLEQWEAESPTSRATVEILRLLILTGCRRSEITGLQWQWVRDGQIHLPQGKTGGRVVWISKQAEAIIARQLKADSPFVFPHRKDPTRPVRFNQDVWYAIRRAAGLEDVRVHDLRHSFASHAIQQGVSLPVLSKLLGHSNMRMTLRYAHVSDTEVEATAERVGEMLAGLLGEQNCGVSDRKKSVFK